MNTLQRNLLGTFALALLLAATGAQAVPLSDLFAGASLTVGDKVFDQWHLIYQDNSAGVAAPDPASIDVTPLSDGGTSPGPGVAFDTNGQFVVVGNDLYAYSDYSFGFRVSTASGLPLIEDNLLQLADGSGLAWSNNGSEDLGMAIVETIRDSLGNILGQTQIEFSTLNGTPTSVFTAHANWSTPQSEIFVEKNILVWSANLTDTASLSGFEQRFSQVPVPEIDAVSGTFAITLVGFVLALAGERRRQGRSS